MGSTDSTEGLGAEALATHSPVTEMSVPQKFWSTRPQNTGSFVPPSEFSVLRAYSHSLVCLCEEMAGKSASLAGAASDTADDEREHDENEVSTVNGEAEAATSKEDQLLEMAVVYIMEKVPRRC